MCGKGTYKLYRRKGRWVVSRMVRPLMINLVAKESGVSTGVPSIWQWAGSCSSWILYRCSYQSVPYIYPINHNIASPWLHARNRNGDLSSAWGFHSLSDERASIDYWNLTSCFSIFYLFTGSYYFFVHVFYLFLARDVYCHSYLHFVNLFGSK